jgi:hypothetical protein
MIEYFTGIAKLVGEKGFDFVIKGKKFDSQCIALGEKVKRELKFNLEVLDEVIKINLDDPENKKEKIKNLFSLMKTNTFDEIDAGIIPIRDYFPKTIQIPVNFQYKQYVKEVKTLSDLLERCYMRLEIIKFHLNHGTVDSDMEYLRKLILLAINEI